MPIGARFGHTCTPLGDGRVVLFGGATGGSGCFTVLADAYEFDPRSKTWSRLETEGPTPPARLGHASVCVGEGHGQVVIYGGSAGGGMLVPEDMYLLDADDLEGPGWAVVRVEGPTPGARYGHAMAFSESQMELVVFGGHNGHEALGDLWTLNIWSRPFGPWRWTQVSTAQSLAPSPRCYHTAAVCPAGGARGMVVVFGGRKSDGACLNDAWGLAPRSDGHWEWTLAPVGASALPEPRYQHTCVFLGEWLLVAGGRGAAGSGRDAPLCSALYDTGSGEWVACDLDVHRCWHACWAAEGVVFSHGGFCDGRWSAPGSESESAGVYFEEADVVAGGGPVGGSRRPRRAWPPMCCSKVVRAAPTVLLEADAWPPTVLLEAGPPRGPDLPEMVRLGDFPPL